MARRILFGSKSSIGFAPIYRGSIGGASYAILILLILLACSFVMVANLITGAPILSLMICTTFIMLLGYSNLKMLSTVKQYVFYTSIFVLKTGLLIYQAIYKNIPMGGSDWGVYHDTAVSILNNNTNLVAIIGNSNDLFSKLVAFVYSIFGVNAEQIYFFVFITSLITFRYIFLSAKEITNDRKTAQIAALLFMIWPIEFIMSITYLREMPIQCLIIISFYYFIKFIKYKKQSNIIGAVILISFASMMHAGVIGILFVYIFIAIVYNSKKGIVVLNPLKIILFMIIIGLLMTSPFADAMTQKFSGINNADDIVERTQFVEGNTAYVTETPKNPVNLITQTPYRMFMFALAPLPWQVYNLSTMIAWLIDGLLRMWIIYRMLKYFIKYKPTVPRDKAIKTTFLLIIVLTYFICAWGTFTYGTAMRHRAKIFPIEIIMVYPCYKMMENQLRESIKKKRSA